MTIDWIKQTYHEFNKRYWDGILPEDIEIKISDTLSNVTGSAGFFLEPKKKIVLTISKYAEWFKENTLLHEMIHIADYTLHPEKWGHKDKNPHGDFFVKEVKRLNKLGWTIYY